MLFFTTSIMAHVSLRHAGFWRPMVEEGSRSKTNRHTSALYKMPCSIFYIARSISSLVPKFYYCRWQDGWHHSCRRPSEDCSCPRRWGRPTKPLNFGTKATPIHHFIFSMMGICAISGWWHRRTERERAKHCCCSCVCWTKWRMIKS